MVNVLIGNKNTDEIAILRQELTNDKIFRIENVVTGTEIITTYWKFSPDILVLDSELPDMSTENIIDRLSCTPLERKRCNTILTVPEGMRKRSMRKEEQARRRQAIVLNSPASGRMPTIV